MVERLCQVGNNIPFWKLLAAHIMTPPFDDHKNNEKKMTTTPVTPFFRPSLLLSRGHFPNNKKSLWFSNFRNRQNNPSLATIYVGSFHLVPHFERRSAMCYF
jgi:hypothetical protein